MAESEIACIRQRIALEYEAAQNGFSGLASGTARHEFIAMRMQDMQKDHERLVVLVGARRAIEMVAETLWGTEESEESTKA